MYFGKEIENVAGNQHISVFRFINNFITSELTGLSKVAVPLQIHENNT